MVNNDVLKKLRVALKLRDEDIIKILELVDFRITKTELGAFFRTEDHPNYKACGDQVLRNFLNGLVIYLRGTKDNPKEPPRGSFNKNRGGGRGSDRKWDDSNKRRKGNDNRVSHRAKDGRDTDGDNVWMPRKKEDRKVWVPGKKRDHRSKMGQKKSEGKVWKPDSKDQPKRKW